MEIALAEFGCLSSRAIAVMCGVDHKTVEAARPKQVGNFPTLPTSAPATVKGSDGKSYPSKRPTPDALLSNTDRTTTTSTSHVADTDDLTAVRKGKRGLLARCACSDGQ